MKSTYSTAMATESSLSGFDANSDDITTFTPESCFEHINILRAKLSGETTLPDNALELGRSHYFYFE